MKNDIVLSVKNVSKDFVLPHERKDSLKERMLSLKKPTYEKFHALRSIDFEVRRGEFFGIVGRNGSGKSTLLKLIGGIYQPSSGSLEVNGTLTPFIELGIGFNPELSGRDNVYLNGAILGLTRKEIEDKYQEIVDFAELHKFMDQKLKNYSSGMQVRLAFSIAIQAHNDILLIDEVLAVGDTAFQRKCFKVFKDMKKSGKTVVFVTHDMGAVQEYCDRAMMIQDSKMLMIGEPREIALRYELANATAGKDNQGGHTLQRPKNPAIKIAKVDMINNEKPTNNFTVSDAITVEITLNVARPIECQVNVFFIKPDGTYLTGINSTQHFKNYKPTKGKHKIRCTFSAGQLPKGQYGVGIGVYTLGYVPDLIDMIDRGYTESMPEIAIIDSSLYQEGIFYIQGKWSK